MSTRLMAPTRSKPCTSLTPVQSGLLQPKCACGGSPGLAGECGCKKKCLQAKLTIGASNDPLEQEAERVSDQVLAAPANPAVRGAAPRIQRFTGQPSGMIGTAPASVDRVLANSGRPLDTAIQQDMGQRFGHDFSQVRVHTGSAAQQSAQDVNANAYTAGHNIVFGVGRFTPGSYEGLRLLAHELTHVVQQGNSPSSGTTKTLRAQPKEKAPLKKTKTKGSRICDRPSRKVAGNEIARVNLDVGANTLTIDWKDPQKIPPGSAGLHNISPGTGLCCVDCNDDTVSQTSGSLCTPKGGAWPVSAIGCVLSGHPTAKNPTYFQRRGIAIHSGNTSSPPRSHGCSRTSVEISELIHDNVVIGKTQIASSGTWSSTKCYMKESTDALSNRKDVCDGNKLKSKNIKADKKKAKVKPQNIIPKASESPENQKPKSAPPPANSNVPIAEAPQLGSDDFAGGPEEMIVDGPGPNNESLTHENISEEFVDDADLPEEIV